MYILLNAGLVLHICGICLMVGMAVAGFVTYRRLFIASPENRSSATVIFATTKLFSKLQMLGGLLIIAGGILMMIAFNARLAEQLWFKIKMALLLALLVNVPLFFRPGNAKLLLLFSGQQSNPSDMQKAKQLLNLYYTLQFLIFLSIFILSVFRFN